MYAVRYPVWWGGYKRYVLYQHIGTAEAGAPSGSAWRAVYCAEGKKESTKKLNGSSVISSHQRELNVTIPRARERGRSGHRVKVRSWSHSRWRPAVWLLSTSAHMMPLEDAFFQWCRTALRICGCTEGQYNDRSAPQLICYLDGLSDEVVKRQLQFRKARKMERDMSHSSLNSLVPVSEDLEFQPFDDRIGMPKTMSTPAMASLLLDAGIAIPYSNSEEQLFPAAAQTPSQHHAMHDHRQ